MEVIKDLKHKYKHNIIVSKLLSYFNDTDLNVRLNIQQYHYSKEKRTFCTVVIDEFITFHFDVSFSGIVLNILYEDDSDICVYAPITRMNSSKHYQQYTINKIQKQNTIKRF